jgi:hypothetical protein
MTPPLVSCDTTLKNHYYKCSWLDNDFKLAPSVLESIQVSSLWP